MKTYDLCVAPRSERDLVEMASVLSELGYKGVALDVSFSRVEYGRAKTIFAKEGLELLSRVTFEAVSGKEVVEKARKFRLSYDIVAVRPLSAEAARVAARDPRVSLILLPPNMARYMDRSQARMLAMGGGCIEVCFRHILEGGDPRKRLRGIIIVVRRAIAFETCLVVTSCARTVWELWPTASLRGFLVSFGLSEHQAKLIVHTNPRLVVSRVKGGA